MLGMREGDLEVVDEEHAVERLDEELDQEVGCEEAGEADVVGRIGVLQFGGFVSSSSRRA